MMLHLLKNVLILQHWPAGGSNETQTLTWPFCVSLFRFLQFPVQWADEDNRQLWWPSHIRRRQQDRRRRLRHSVQRSPQWQTYCSEKAQPSKWTYCHATLIRLQIFLITTQNMISFRWTTTPWTSCESSSTKRSKLWKCTFRLLSLSSLIWVTHSQFETIRFINSSRKALNQSNGTQGGKST